MTGGESEEERSLYLLSICLCVVPCAMQSSLLFLETEEALFWETKVKLPMLEMLSDRVFLGNLQIVHLIFIRDRLGQTMYTVQTFSSCLEGGCVHKTWGVPWLDGPTEAAYFPG